MNFNNDVVNILVNVTSLDKSEIKNLLETPPNKDMGDVAFPCYKLAGKLKNNPNKISEELTDKIDLSNYESISKVSNQGPYINFFYNIDKIKKSVFDEFYGIEKNYIRNNTNKKTIVVEFPAPNTNKPLHLGHLRNLILSESVCRLLESQGHDVKRVNLNNDRGIHICKSMIAYKKWGDNKKPDKKSDHFVGDYYVLYSQKLKENPALEEETREMLRKWEDGDEEVMNLWSKMRDWALDGFKETYDRFDVKFEKEYFESDIYQKGKQKIQNALEEGTFKKNDEGAIVADLKDYGEKVLLREDGTSIYITQDIALAYEKYEDFKYDKSVYVVGSEQEYHFKVLFKVLELLGFESEMYHLSFGMINLPSGKMKSREGNVVDADNLLDDLKEMTLDEVKKRGNVDENNSDQISENIALSALRFFILKYSPHKDFTFRPKESISLEGETGPYLQYSLVRSNRILEKSNISLKKSDINLNLIKEDEEINLIKKISEFDEILNKSADNYSPHYLANYSYELASLFNSFYENIRVIGIENKKLEKTRLGIVKLYYDVMKCALYHLGIKDVKVM